ncbi:hypothetical protein D3C73_491020 [compost metagenome]
MARYGRAGPCKAGPTKGDPHGSPFHLSPGSFQKTPIENAVSRGRDTMKKLSDHKIKSVRKPIRPIDRTERTLKAQSDALTQHEATIARHTKLQTYVAILTTAILATITYFQYKAGEREVALEYAKTSNQYSVSMTYIDGYGDIVPGASFGTLIPATLKIRRESGLGTIGEIRTYQAFKLGTPSYNSKCEVWIPHPFRQVENGSLELKPQEDFLDLAKLKTIKGPSGKTAQVLSTNTVVVIEFRDIFGKTRRDILKGYGSTFELIQGSEDPSYKHVKFDTMLLSFPDIRFMSLSEDVPALCRDWVRPYQR